MNSEYFLTSVFILDSSQNSYASYLRCNVTLVPLLSVLPLGSLMRWKVEAAEDSHTY